MHLPRQTCHEEGRTAEWDGVRSYQARNTIRDDMKAGDGVLFYHSESGKQAVVGTAVVVREGYPDFTAWDPGSDHPDPRSTPDSPVWYMVDIRAEGAFASPVSLAAIKATPALASMALVKNSRLSVQPVTGAEWETVVRLGS